MSNAPEMGFVPSVFRNVTTTDGVRLAVRDYRAERADAPTAVLLHGLLLSQASWDAQVRHLRRRWGTGVRVLTFDHRGHGRSAAAPMRTYEIDRLAADLADVLSAMRITGPLTLAGHSMGGMAALAYLDRSASARPVDPRGLVLVGTAAGRLPDRGIPRLLGTPATEALFGLVDRLPQRAMNRAVRAVARPLGDTVKWLAGDNAVGTVTADAVRATSLTTAAGFLPSLKHYDVSRSLGSITAATFVVSGGADVMTPVSHSRDIASAIPGAVHLHHPTAGHLLLQEAADCVSGAIDRAMGMRRGARCPEFNAHNAPIAACGD